MSEKNNPKVKPDFIKGIIALLVIVLLVRFCSSGDEENSRTKSVNSVYTPQNNAMLATSKECFDKAIDAVNAGDRAAFNLLVLDNCILIYESSKMNFKLVLKEVGGIGKPNIYLKQGSSNEKYWAYKDAVD
jgi:hypothetical protein